MGHLTTVRIGFALCLLTSFVFLTFKMFHQFDTINTSFRGAPTSFKIQQLQLRVMDTKITAIEKVQSTVSRHKSNDVINLTTAATKTQLPAAAVAAATKSASATAATKSNNVGNSSRKPSVNNTHEETLMKVDDNGHSHTTGDFVADKKVVYEQRFLNDVELFLRKLPANNSYGDTLAQVIERSKSRTPNWERKEEESLHDSQFLNYTKCPTSVRTKIQADPFTRRRFVPETPILAWNEHYTPEEYSRLARFHGIFGWQDTNETDIASALTGLNSVRNRYLFDDRMVNGNVPNDGRCIRCAVIGNGGILNGSRKGKEIDANDYVFRVNTALTKGYEEDVGRRTSFYCFGIITLSNTLAGGFRTKFNQPPNDEGIRYVFFGDSYWAYTYLASVLHGGKGTTIGRRYPIRFPKQLHAEDVKLVHPDFERYLKWSWVNSTYQHRPIHRPTTGGIMLLLALHTCDEVNVYGFGGSYTKFSEHYYDVTFNKHISYANHDNGAENSLWKQLHELGIINMYTRG